MRDFFGLILLMLFVWILWATFSTGELHKLKQLNPEYPHPDKNVAFLISKLNYSSSNGIYDSYHVEFCAPAMPDWIKTRECVETRIACEHQSPRKKDFYRESADLSSDEFNNCWNKNRPAIGLNEYLNASRMFWRVLIGYGSIWIMGGFNNEGENAVKWDKKNRWWATPMTEWIDESK